MERKHGPYTIKSSECLYSDEFVEFWVDEVVRPNGEPGRYATLRMLPGVSVLAADEEGFVYLVRQFRYAVGKESLEAVAGGVERGEEPFEAARRELREELGIEAEELIDLGVVDAVTSQVFSPSRIFLARGLKFVEADGDEAERLETVKVKLDEAVRMVLDGEITQSTTVVLVLKTSRVLQGESGGR